MKTKIKNFTLTILMVTAMLGVLAFMLGLTGCVQFIAEKDRLQINTFLTSSGFESFYWDPDGFVEVGDYQGIPADLEFVYNPITNTFTAKTESQ